MLPFNLLIIRRKFILNLSGFIVKRFNTMLALLTGLDTAMQAGWEMLVKERFLAKTNTVFCLWRQRTG